MSEVQRPLDETDFYWDDGKMVLTASYHLRRGSCCGNGCRHCPFSSGTIVPIDDPSMPQVIPTKS